MRCKHENAVTKVCINRIWRECLDCEKWLPLGKSNDSPATLVELRAAKVAQDVAELTEWCMYVRGGYGEEIARGYSCAESNMAPHSAEWHAGYLARCIHDHKDNTP